MRQAIGPNDHPCTPTFLQVYKMLAVYSILKPPKSGNCSILNPETPKITISDLKTIFNTNDITEKEKKIEHLRKTLDSYVTVGLEVEDVFHNNDHNYFKVDAETCILYYICGYITRYFMKHINCKVC